MHILSRKVRFSINPFLTEDQLGHNAFASKPAGTGLAFFFELTVTIKGSLNAASGFVINITDIDEQVRKHVVPIFAKKIRQKFQNQSHISIYDTAGLLKSAWQTLVGKFNSAELINLNLALNPFRNIAINHGEPKMVYFSEKFECAATHRLYNKDLTEKQNFELFGKCANPSGHGHNYTIEVTVTTDPNDNFSTQLFEKTVNDQLIELLDHKNLNADIDYFKNKNQNINPTVENIAVFAWDTLNNKFNNATLYSVTIWETNKTSCTYRG